MQGEIKKVRADLRIEKKKVDDSPVSMRHSIRQVSKPPCFPERGVVARRSVDAELRR
jgi:hypothetical protein